VSTLDFRLYNLTFCLGLNVTNLKFGHGFLLDSENDQIFASDPDGGRAFLDGLLSIFHLLNVIV